MPKRQKKKLKGHEWRHIENKKLIYTVYFILRVSVVLMLVAQFFNQNYENMLLCVLTLVLFTLPSLFERRLHEMQAKGAKTGLATLCIGGGMGCSTIVKIED